VMMGTTDVREAVARADALLPAAGRADPDGENSLPLAG
jgi:hypothetical protein